MQAGKLNRLVKIQRRVGAQDETGQPVDEWEDVAQTWADIRFSKGLEAVKGDTVASVASASVRIRYRTGVDAGMRLVHANAVFDIRAVLPDLANRQYVDLVCEVGQNDG